MRLPFIGHRPWPPIWSLVERSFPLLMGFLAILVSSLFSTHGKAEGLVPMLGSVVIFYWCLYLPALMPLVGLLCLGFVQDTISGDPLGLGFLTFLPIVLVTKSRTAGRFGANFIFAWLLCLLVMAMSALVHYGISAALAWRVLDVRPVASRYGAAVLVYPLVAVGFAWFEIRLASAIKGVDSPGRNLRK